MLRVLAFKMLPLHIPFWALAQQVADLYFGFSISIVCDARIELGAISPTKYLVRQIHETLSAQRRH